MTIRRHATRLQLDTSHFTGQRPWSDAHLRDAVSSAGSWSQVLHLLDVNNNGAAITRVRGHAARLQLDTSHLEPPQRPRPSQPPLQLTMLRNAAVHLATAWFALRAVPTAVPNEQQPYDLLAAFSGRYQRVQVKSSTCRTKRGKWLVSVGRRPYSLDKTAGRAPYDPESFDFYFVVIGDGGLYLIPNQVLAGRTRIEIDSYPEYRVGDASSLLT